MALMSFTDHIDAKLSAGPPLPFCGPVDTTPKDVKRPAFGTVRDAFDEPFDNEVVVIAGSWELDIMKVLASSCPHVVA
jgi:hypothetical protein